jgi:hypothetical protein
MLCGGGRRAAGQRAQETTRQQQATRADPRLFLTHARTYSLSKSSMPKLATDAVASTTLPLPGNFQAVCFFPRLIFWISGISTVSFLRKFVVSYPKMILGKKQTAWKLHQVGW